MTPRRVTVAFGGTATLALIVVGLLQLSHRSAPTAPPLALSRSQIETRLAGSPPPLAALHAEANELLPGGGTALRKRLGVLRGHAVVINKWASWCEPCRAEFGVFQRAAVDLGRRVAFIGIDSRDGKRGDAQSFLRSYPVSYPSYYDPGGGLGAAVTDSSSLPVTVFYNARGSEYIHQGPYPSLAKLERDIERYALEA